MGWLDDRKSERAQRVEQMQIERDGGRGERGSLDPGDFVIVLRKALHVGGFPGAKDRDLGQLRVNVEGVVFENLYGSHELPWSDVEWIEVTERTEAKSRVAEAALFGVAGLGATGSQTIGEVLFHLRSGPIAVFAGGASASALRVELGPTAASASIPFEPKPAIAAGRGLVEELERLAALHAAGALTNEEFADFKTQLRSR